MIQVLVRATDQEVVVLLHRAEKEIVSILSPHEERTFPVEGGNELKVYEKPD